MSVRAHLSGEKIEELRDVEQGVSFKPYGLWYDYDDSWSDWVVSEQFGRKYNYKYNVDISGCNILSLSDSDSVVKFGSDYGDCSPWKRMGMGVDDLILGTRLIDWHRVVEDYDGIEIIPYQHDLRFKLMWYGVWDIASGCVWNCSNLKIELVEEINIERTLK